MAACPCRRPPSRGARLRLALDRRARGGGRSAGAALAGAAKVASQISSGTIVFIVCDGGWKYLSTGAYTDDLHAAAMKAEEIIYF